MYVCKCGIFHEKNIVHNNDYLRCTCCTSNQLPCGKTSFLLIWKLYNKLVHAVNPRYAVHAATSRLPCRHLFFPWVSRTRFSWQMAWMRFQASPTGQPNKDHPIRSSPPFIPSNEACIPSSVSWSFDKSTSAMVLFASRAAARACQCWRLLLQSLKFQTHHGYKLWNHLE